MTAKDEPKGLGHELKRNLPIIVLLPVVALLGARLRSTYWPYEGTAPVTSRVAPKRTPSGKVARGWIGIEVDPHELPQGGVRITRIFAGSPAAFVGLLAQDVILDANDKPATPASLQETIAETKLGANVKLKRKRPDGTEGTLTVPVMANVGVTGLVTEMLAAGSKGLVDLQLPNELWPHFHERTLDREVRAGVASSALACAALAAVGEDAGDLGRSALEHGIAVLLENRKKAPQADGGLFEPGEEVQHRVYANSLFLMALVAADREKYATEIGELRDWLLKKQIDSSVVDELDWRFGAWNYFEEGMQIRADVSVTAWALEALAASGVPKEHPVWQRAGRFLDRCRASEVVSRNAEDQKLEATLRDGGFAFMPRFSKPGQRDVGAELTVFRSYGSATADGVRGLLAVNGGGHGATQDERAEAALKWLARRFTVQTNPGFDEDDPYARGIHFYWICVAARGLGAGGIDGLKSGEVEHAWPDEVARFLANRIDHTSGQWQSPNNIMSENSKTIATSFALLALAAVRDRLAAHNGAVLDGGTVAPEPPVPVELWNPKAASVLERGRHTFQDTINMKCTECHLDDGNGNAPSLVGVADRYLEAKRTHDKAADYLRHYVRAPQDFPGFRAQEYAARGLTMPAFGAGTMTDEQLNDLVEFLLSRFGSLKVAKCEPLAK